jgi:hypothetical protein
VDVILQDRRRLPVLDECEVVVVGGGLSGVAAAVTTARKGMRTILIAERSYLGREVVSSYSCTLDQADKALSPPIKREIIEMLEAVGGYKKDRLDVGILQLALDRLVQTSSVKVYFLSRGVKAILEGNTVKGVIVANKSGRQAILSELVVDASEEARVAAGAGAKFQPEDEFVTFKRSFVVNSAALETPVIVRVPTEMGLADDRVYIHPTLWGGELVVTFYLYGRYDPKNPRSFTRASFNSMRKVFQIMNYLKGNVPGFENAMLTGTSNEPLFLSGSRIIGQDMITFQEAITEHSVPPGVGCAVTYMEDMNEETVVFYIPYGCLRPRGLKGILVCSPHISVDQVIQPFLFQFSNALQLGEGTSRFITGILRRGG